MRLGELIRGARQGRYTVEELASLADVSSGLISQIERGAGNPSFVTLSKLAYALELPLGAFFQGLDGEQGTERMVVRRDKRRKLELPHEGLTYELLTPPAQRSFVILTTTLRPGFQNQERPFVHPGQEAIHVVRGTVHIYVQEREFVLADGDTITYDSSMPHWWRNRSDEPVDVIGVVTPSHI